MAEILYREVYDVERGSFDTAGEASSKIKRTLKKMGIAPAILREAAIVSYELELNLVIHSLGGTLTLEIEPDMLRIRSADRGPGIQNIALAMTEGYSTASEEVRSMGFGAGMGLPNVKRHSHSFSIRSEVGEGTVIEANYLLDRRD
ncbi:MAG: ATP-binding protein [Clostridiaceae bacterium]|nr:anti-sigma regulatory factor [Eubacteriales bacterium]